MSVIGDTATLTMILKSPTGVIFFFFQLDDNNIFFSQSKLALLGLTVFIVSLHHFPRDLIGHEIDATTF